MRSLLLLVLALCLGACALPEADPEREAQADRAYALVRANDVSGLKAVGTPALQALDLTGPMTELQQHVRASAPTASQTVGWGLQTSSGVSTYRLARLYEHPEGAVQAEVVMIRTGDGPWQVDGLRAVRVSKEATQAHAKQIEAARFSFNGKSALHYLILAAAALSAIICLGSAIFAGFRRRWGWMLLNLFGIGQVSLNWATGAVGFQPIFFTLLGAGFMKGVDPADPWFIMAALPIPALLFWGLGKWKSKPARKKPEAGEAASPAVPD